MKFETGQYQDAVDLLRKALELMLEEPDDSAKKQKLYARLAKSHAHISQVEEVRSMIEHLAGDRKLQDSLRSTSDTLKAWQASAETSNHRKAVLERLGRYKPSL